MKKLTKALIITSLSFSLGIAMVYLKPTVDASKQVATETDINLTQERFNILSEIDICKKNLESFRSYYNKIKSNFNLNEETNNSDFINLVKYLNLSKENEKNISTLIKRFEETTNEIAVPCLDAGTYKDLLNTRFSSKITENLISTSNNLLNNIDFIDKETKYLSDSLRTIKDLIINHSVENEKISKIASKEVDVKKSNMLTQNDYLEISTTKFTDTSQYYKINFNYFTPNLTDMLKNVDKKYNLVLEIINPQTNEIVLVSNVKFKSDNDFIEELKNRNNKLPENKRLTENQIKKGSVKAEFYGTSKLDVNQNYIFKVVNVADQQDLIKFDFKIEDMKN